MACDQVTATLIPLGLDAISTLVCPNSQDGIGIPSTFFLDPTSNPYSTKPLEHRHWNYTPLGLVGLLQLPGFLSQAARTQSLAPSSLATSASNGSLPHLVPRY